MAPLALQPEFRPKPQDTPTRLLAREASELRQTEFIPWGQFSVCPEVILGRRPRACPRPLPLAQLATRRYDLDLPAALDEVVDDERDGNEDDRERKKPGPPAVSCDEHIDLRCWG